jgi:hypothetical protein
MFSRFYNNIMNINIKSADGSISTITGINETALVSNLKQAIQEQTGKRPIGYHLIFNGVTLEPNMALAEHGVKNGVTISAVPSGLKD